MSADVRLRPVEDRDLDVFFRHQADPEAWRMAAMEAPEPKDRAAFDAHWKKVRGDPTVVSRAIVLGDAVVGNVVCFGIDGEREVGYWVGREHWGRGIASAALRALVALVPDRPLHARCAKDNRGSVRVLERAGFRVRREGRMKSGSGEVDELGWVLD